MSERGDNITALNNQRKSLARFLPFYRRGGGRGKQDTPAGEIIAQNPAESKPKPRRGFLFCALLCPGVRASSTPTFIYPCALGPTGGSTPTVLTSHAPDTIPSTPPGRYGASITVCPRHADVLSMSITLQPHDQHHRQVRSS